MKSYFVLIFCFFCFDSYSQVEEFETSYQYCFEDVVRLNLPYESENIIGTKSYTGTIKVDLTKGDFSSGLYLMKFIIRNVKEGKINAYSIKDGNKLNYDEVEELISTRDTIITFNPENYEENVEVSRRVSLENIVCYRIVQNWKLTKEKMTVEVKKIIPLYKENEFYRELFFVEFESGKEEEGLVNNESISWLKVNEENVPFEEIRAKSINLKEIVWERSKSKETDLYVDGFEKLYSNREKLNEDYFSTLSEFPPVDTVITFDPETYAEKIEIIAHEKIRYEDICGFKIYQAWYVNHKNLKIGSRLLAITPLIKLTDKVLKEDRYVPLYLRLINEVK